MEYCEKGDLSKELERRRRGKLYYKEEDIWTMFMQMVLAIHEMHKIKKKKLLHRGIQPENILIDSDDVLKLGDFGHAKILDKES